MITARPLLGDQSEPYLELRTTLPEDVYGLRAWLSALGEGWKIDDPEGHLEGEPELPWTVNLRFEVADV